jgi:hypothetical protein
MYVEAMHSRLEPGNLTLDADAVVQFCKINSALNIVPLGRAQHDERIGFLGGQSLPGAFASTDG